jgi:hypothetical protein
MTLILTTALSGNLATLFSGSTKWEFHFHEVIVLTAVIYSYTWCLPFLLWGFMIWRKTDDRYSLLQLLTIYGYSMAAFIPLTVSGWSWWVWLTNSTTLPIIVRNLAGLCLTYHSHCALLLLSFIVTLVDKYWIIEVVTVSSCYTDIRSVVLNAAFAWVPLGFVLVRSIWQPFRNETRRVSLRGLTTPLHFIAPSR